MRLADLREQKQRRSPWPEDPRLAERHLRLTQALRAVMAGRGKITSRMLASRNGWGNRSALRYLTELQNAGLIRWTCGKSMPQRWAVTQAGIDELSGVT